MNKDNLNTIILFVGLVLLQIAVLNNINFLGYINPFLYILFIFYYPIKKIDTQFIFLSFFLGLAIDVFSNSGGINAAATLFIAFIRMPVLKSIIGKREIDYSAAHISKLPYYKAFLYIIILTFVHHFIVFGLEYFKWNNFGIIIIKTFLTSIFTIILIMISYTLIARKK
ncbi:MAG: rod shape-determining protein MreD [Flavobacteriaceae bacterium]|nr:rod shape-determining protein MreD [Flavobacteriaceae bacterium]